MNHTLLVSFIIYGLCMVAIEAHQGFYWKDYNGDVPTDAVPVVNSQDNDVFVGKAVAPGYSILPGTLKRGRKELFYEHSRQGHYTADDVMILSGSDLKRFEWIGVTRGQSVASVTEPDKSHRNTLIPGGSNFGNTLVVGRLTTGSGEVLVGKVHVTDNKFETINAGNGVTQANFDVLVYNEEKIIH